VTSPWRLALGDAVDRLDPGLRDYVAVIPAGSVGRGVGVFDVVGTPRRWLWPVLAVLGRAAIAFPVWERHVPFEVENRPTAGGVAAIRRFRFRSGDREMHDEIRVADGHLVDRLGRRGRLEARMRASVVDGRLELRSDRVAIRIGGLRLPIPLAPRFRLVERRLDDGRQRVEFELRAPLLGRIYEYAGEFRYRLEET
jgi:hypothetical protein